jgi:hypothetical protein
VRIERSASRSATGMSSSALADDHAGYMPRDLHPVYEVDLDHDSERLLPPPAALTCLLDLIDSGLSDLFRSVSVSESGRGRLTEHCTRGLHGLHKRLGGFAQLPLAGWGLDGAARRSS